MITTMSKALSNTFTLVLACVGALIAGWLTLEHFLPQAALPCGAVGDCRGTLGSSYGQLGPLPTAAFGFGMYLFIAFLCLQRKKQLGTLRVAESKRAEAYASAGAEESAPTAAPAPDATAGLR